MSNRFVDRYCPKCKTNTMCEVITVQCSPCSTSFNQAGETVEQLTAERDELADKVERLELELKTLNKYVPESVKLSAHSIAMHELAKRAEGT